MDNLQGGFGMKKNVWSNAEFYLLLGMLVFCAILVWQFSIITVSESRIFPSVILAVSISAAAIQAVHVFGKGDFLDVHKALLTGREWLALLVLLASYFSYDRLGFYATIFLVLVAISLLVQKEFTPKTVVSTLVFDIILLALTYVCFGLLLKMATPTGIFY